MAEIPPLNVKVNVDASGVSAGVAKASAAMKQLSASGNADISKMRDGFNRLGQQIARSMKIAAAAVGALAVKLGTDAVQAAIADEKSQVMLANALRNSTGATKSAIAGVEEYITKLQKTYSVADDELRPALARLATATGSVAMGQKLMGTALDVSAFAGVDLATASDAVIKATKGQFKALAMLVPGIDLATIKGKDLTKIFEEVGKITAGSASARAKTFEYRLKGLKLAFGEILESLGYRLMPVLEKFVTMLQSRILPQIEAWIALNGDKLAAGLQKAAEAALELVIAAAKFGNWVVNNIGTIKTLAVILATMWGTSKVIAFAKAINAVTIAYRGMATAQAAAGGTTFLGPITKNAAKGGMFATLFAALAAGNVGEDIGGWLAEQIPGTSANRLKTAKNVFGNPAYNPKSPSALDVSSGIFASSASATPTATTDDLAEYLKAIEDELKKGNAKEDKDKTIQYVTIYASNTNDIAKKLAKAAKNGQPIGGK